MTKAAEKSRILSLEEAIAYSRRVIWLETRESETGAVPVTYHSEQLPFLRFDCDAFPAMYSVRPEWYGKTWRCWDVRPEWPADWEPAGDEAEAAEPVKAPAKKAAAQKRPRGRK